MPMATEKTIFLDFGGAVCRRCINQRYGANLQPKDCKYDSPYAQICPVCQEVHHIVHGLTASGKIKMLLK